METLLYIFIGLTLLIVMACFAALVFGAVSQHREEKQFEERRRLEKLTKL
jgi:hypothetical protein